MWIKCCVPGCNKVRKAHNNSNSEVLGLCREHRDYVIPAQVSPAFELPVKLHTEYVEGKHLPIPTWIVKLRQLSL
jgi:hypothetical protein